MKDRGRHANNINNLSALWWREPQRRIGNLLFHRDPTEWAKQSARLIDTVAERLFGFAVGNLVAAFTIVSIAASISAMIIAGPRVYFAMARDVIHQYTGTPPAISATPAAEVPGLRHNSFTTITAHAATKIAGAQGYPQARNGRGASGSRRRSTNSALTAMPENRTSAKPV